MELFILIICLLIILMVSGLPVVYSVGITSVLSYLFYILQVPGRDFSMALIAQRIVDGANSFPLLAIPLFLFAGQLMNEGGITERLFDVANSIVGRMRGGLGHVNVGASLIFSGMSGAAVADVAGLGLIEIKAMRNAGYGGGFSCAVTGASAIIGPIVPPSIPMVVYGALAGVSVGKLFLGGIGPGVVMTLLMMIFVAFIAYRRNYPLGPKMSFREKLACWKRGVLPLFTPVIIIGGIWTGVCTPTEAASLASVYSILLCCFIYRTVSPQKLWAISKKSAIDSVAIIVILACSSFYSHILTMMRIPFTLAADITQISHDPLTILVIMNLFLLIMGCFLPAMVLINIFTPILVPIVTRFGIDPVFFGVVMVLNLMIGMLTPPYGIVLFTLAQITDVPFEEIIKESVPFYISLILALVVLLVFPSLVTFIPNSVTF